MEGRDPRDPQQLFTEREGGARLGRVGAEHPQDSPAETKKGLRYLCVHADVCGMSEAAP